MTPSPSQVWGASGRSRWLPIAALAAVIYPPLLLTAPGRVVADTKSYLYLDPGRLLDRAVSMWDPHVGMGTVPHQQIGYLWPSGPYYWLMEAIGSPDWVAQRLWLGSIMMAAGAGVLYLGRTWRWKPNAALAAAFVYALSPFVLTLAARISVILLPFAGLPWLLALTVRSVRNRGWRYPAAFALVVATIGSVNATALLLVGIVPVGWILYSLWSSTTVTRARAASTIAKLGVLTLAVNLWWIGGLSVQATNGLDVLRYTETAQVVADSSTAPEVLRGLGYWFFYGGDRLGPWIEPGADYTQHLWLIALTYAIPVVGLLGLGISRWRHRVFVIGMLAVGTVVSVGAHPWDDPSPIGAVVKVFLSADVGLAMRSLPRAVPLVALATALGIGALVGAATEQSSRRGMGAMAAAMLAAIAALPPLWMGDLAPDNLQRPEDIPDYWNEVAAHLDDTDDGTRVLEIPGIDFASYRWGNTVDPITPGLTDRPYVARELIPYGSPASADLLNSLDLGLQEQTLGDDALAAIARLMNVGQVITRNDLQYERYNTPRPRSLWDRITSEAGLGAPTVFGADVPNVPDADAPLLDEEHLVHDGALPEAPAVGVFPVDDRVPIVHAHGTEAAVILSGDGAGIVHAAEAGLIHGDELIRYSANVTDGADFVRSELVDDRALIVTDTNRRSGERWTTVRHTQGYTEQADGGLLRDDVSDNRLPVFTDRPGIRSVAEHVGLSARATGYGNPITYLPEDRPVNAVDGDVETAWRVAAFSDARGERIELASDDAIETGEVRLVQPTTGEVNRWITEVALRFDDGDPVRVRLDETSRTSPGQTIEIDQASFETMSIEILDDTAGDRPGYAGLTSVGFAEIDLGVESTREYIRMPQDLLDAGGFRTLRYPLALIHTRQRTVSTDVTRSDPERSLARVVDLPTARSYRLTGTVRLSAEADPTVLDLLTGRDASNGPAITARSTLPGGLGHLPSNVLDADPATRWTSAFGSPADERLTVRLTSPSVLSELSLQYVDDDEHSAPRQIVVTADGVEVGRVTLTPAPTDASGLRSVTVPFEAPAVASEVTVSFVEVEERTTIDWYTGEPRALPLSVATLSIDGASTPQRAAQIDSGCRNDLVYVDGVGVPVRVTGDTATALRGDELSLTTCDDRTITLTGGDRRIDSAEGRSTGFDIDQLVWCSAAGGDGCDTQGPLLAGSAAPAPTVEVIDESAATVRIQVSDAVEDEPFWLVLGQSFNSGWEVLEDDVISEPTALVDGYANGFLVTPTSADFEVTLRFAPQNRVEIGLLLSVVGVVATVGLALGSTRPAGPVPIPLQEPLRRIRALSWEGALPTRRDAMLVGLGAGLAGTLVANPLIGLLVGLLSGFATRREGWRAWFTVLPAALLAIAGLYVLAVQFRNEFGPGLHWPLDTGRLHTFGLAAIVLLAVDVVIDAVWARRSDFR